MLVGETVWIFQVPASGVSIAAFGLARRTAAAVLPVFLAVIRIKLHAADTAGPLTASHGILTPSLRERIPDIQTDYFGKERFSSLSTELTKERKRRPKKKEKTATEYINLKTY